MMKIIIKITDARKWYEVRKDQTTKIEFQKDGFYKCIGLSVWYRFDNYAFRLEEIYYFLGLRDHISLDTPFETIIKRMIPVINKDFKDILLDAQEFYTNLGSGSISDNFQKYYDWSCMRGKAQTKIKHL